MGNLVCLNNKYSTTKLLYKLIDDECLDENGKIKEECKWSINNSKFNIKNSKLIGSPEDKFETVLFLPEGEGRKGEGGLRTKGYFKFSYENLMMNDEYLIMNDKYGNRFKYNPSNSTFNIQHSKLNTLPLISIITVVYNGEKYLEKTIQSVINQTYPNIEYIIIDGGSTDGTLDIIKKYEDKIDYWVSEMDKGISDAFNKGIVSSVGDFILILNAGDIFVNEASVIEMIKFINKSNSKNSIFTNNLIFDKKYKQVVNKPAGISKIKEKIPFNHPGTYVPKSIYKKVGLYDVNLKIAMDYDFFIRCYISNVDFKYFDIEHIIMDTNGVSATNFIKAYKEAYFIQNKYFKNRIKSLFYLYKKIIFHYIGYIRNKIMIRLKK